MADNIPAFGDYIEIEQKRFGCPNEMYVYKVIGTLNSNSWRDVPVRHDAPETLHNTCEDIVQAICCGIREEKVERFRIADVRITKRRFPENSPPPQAAGGEPVAWLIDYDTEDGRVRTVVLTAPADSMWPYGTIITPLCLPSGKEWSTADVSAAYMSGQSDIRTLVRDLAERWERLAEVHGQRQFTGNDHRLFANELRAVAGLPTAAAPAQPAGGRE